MGLHDEAGLDSRRHGERCERSGMQRCVGRGENAPFRCAVRVNGEWPAIPVGDTGICTEQHGNKRSVVIDAEISLTDEMGA
eukprot:scaffold64815_cov34-Tisochrysis_lutea.AAC.6